MKKFTLFSLAVLMGTLGMAQSGKQVKWTYTSKKIADKTYEIHLTASIGGGWHMYAQNGGDGPISTAFTFTKNPLVAFNDKPKEVGKMIKKYEDAFKSDVRYYENTVDFVQVVKVKGSAKTAVAGKVEFMVCNDHECLPPDETTFSVNIGG
ncbi:MAG TPA: protein-disulfide reductase DsbD domain-containing protein [Puia sp.]|nr:protein-disulfide reductase DsbD domain-containing protein [Puia sp.]